MDQTSPYIFNSFQHAFTLCLASSTTSTLYYYWFRSLPQPGVVIFHFIQFGFRVGPAAVESAVAFTNVFLGVPAPQQPGYPVFQDCTWWLLCLHSSGLTLSLDFVDHSTSYASYAAFIPGVSFALSSPFRPQCAEG